MFHNSRFFISFFVTFHCILKISCTVFIYFFINRLVHFFIFLFYVFAFIYNNIQSIWYQIKIHSIFSDRLLSFFPLLIKIYSPSFLAVLTCWLFKLLKWLFHNFSLLELYIQNFLFISQIPTFIYSSLFHYILSHVLLISVFVVISCIASLISTSFFKPSSSLFVIYC